MQLKQGKKSTFFDLIIRHVITEVTLLLVIIILYVGYGFIDNMFITKEKERENNMKKIKSSISDYTNKINEYQNLLTQIRATGADKRVVSGLYLSRIESIFQTLATSFDIKNITLSLDAIDPLGLSSSIKLTSLPSGVRLVAYSFSISGKVDVETDVYNMLSFLEIYLPGVVITKNVSINSSSNSQYNFENMLKISELNMKVDGEWFFLTND